MSDVIVIAKTGRSKCRGCGAKIALGELRFGESVPNPYAEGETSVWFHLVCAACMRPERLLPALKSSTEPVVDREWLEQAALWGEAHRRLPRLVRAERAPVGRARCRLCRELEGKGDWRLALQTFEEGRMMPLGTIHLQCAEAYFGTADILDRICRLSPGLTEADQRELDRLLSEQRSAPESPSEGDPKVVGASQESATTELRVAAHR